MYACGMEQLLDTRLPQLTGSRVALVAHPASILADGSPAAVRLRDAIGERLVALLGPEHGYTGQAGPGVAVSHHVHPDWGIPVYSLYGAATDAWSALAGKVDTLIFDLQDLGVRCYTYLHTLLQVMRAADRYGWRVLVTDRVVPWAPMVDGPVAAESADHAVCPAPVPLVYGMTPGETARWYRRHAGLALDLDVVPAIGYTRAADPVALWSCWVPPSPAIRSLACAYGFPLMVFTEASQRWHCARETAAAFCRLQGAVLDASNLAQRLQTYAWPGIEFAVDAPDYGALVLRVTDPRRCRPAVVAVTLLYELQRWGGGDLFTDDGINDARWFDLLMGTAEVRLALQAGAVPGEIVAGWNAPLARFRRERAAALLY